MNMSTTTINNKDLAIDLDNWLVRLNDLANQVAGWVEAEPDWSVEWGKTVITEDEVGTYTAPTLTIFTVGGRAVLEPIALLGFGVRGIVELYAWPTLRRVRLLIRDDVAKWEVMTDSGIKLRQPWDHANPSSH